MPNDFEQTHIDDKKALQNFLLDIDCLNDLEPWTNRFNLFDILKISKTEIRHSNMLAWLLDPKENHGLDVSVLKGFMKSLDFSTTNIQDLSLIKYNHFKVYREWKNVDLLLISDTDKMVICIENKIFSGEHDNQLNRYLDTICNHYPNYDHLFVYLTPNGDTPSDSENWQNFAYTELLQIIETAMSQNTILPNATILIQNYIETVRCHIVGDQELIRICNEIYKKHKNALDLIYENKSDNRQNITDYIYNYMHSIHNDFSFNTKKCSKTYLRFTTKNMSGILKDMPTESSGWNTNNHYFYEITNKNGIIRLQLSLSKGNLSIAERDSYFDTLIHALPPSEHKPAWIWKIVKSWPILQYKDEDVLEDIQYDLENKLDYLVQEILSFEEELRKELYLDQNV